MFCIIVRLLVAGPAHAQDAFSSVSVRAAIITDANRSAIHEYWHPGLGGTLAGSTPFYFGEAEIGAAVHRYEAVDLAVPRFDALLAYVGWGFDLSPIDFVAWYGGVAVGNYRMTFDEETFAGVRNESELTLGLHTRVDLRISPVLSLFAAGRYMRIYTAPRFETAFVGGGIGVTFDTPRWLEILLR